jgi:hypothetical protein
MHSVAAQGMHTVAVLDGRALMLRMSQKLSSVELGDIFENAIKRKPMKYYGLRWPHRQKKTQQLIGRLTSTKIRISMEGICDGTPRHRPLNQDGKVSETREQYIAHKLLMVEPNLARGTKKTKRR